MKSINTHIPHNLLASDTKHQQLSDYFTDNGGGSVNVCQGSGQGGGIHVLGFPGEGWESLATRGGAPRGSGLGIGDARICCFLGLR
jgi:hypothetical protein